MATVQRHSKGAPLSYTEMDQNWDILDNITNTSTTYVYKGTFSDVVSKGPIADVRAFGAVGDGVADDTAAIQAAIDSFSSGGGVVYFPKGTYLVTSTLTVSQNRMSLVGDGQWVSVIRFNPTTDDICIFFGKGGEGTTDAGIIVQCSVRGLTFTSTNTTYKKTALELKDISIFICDNVAIGSTTQWIGNGSIGVRTRGREMASFSNMAVQTNRPFVFAINTSETAICCDQFSFYNIFTACRGHYETVPIYNETSFFFEPGTNFSNMSFYGYQSWNRGKNGLYYDNSGTPAAGSSYGMNIQNVRWEGTFGDDDSGYAFYFSHGSTGTTQNVTITNAYLGEIGNGYYFRRCSSITLTNGIWTRAGGECLNINSDLGNEFIQIVNCFWQTSCTATIDTDFTVINAVKSDNTAPVYKSAIYSASTGANRKDLITNTPINQGLLTVAATDPTYVTLPIDPTATGIGTFADSRGRFALFGFNVVGKTTRVIYSDGIWSNTNTTAANLNVYWNSANTVWELENKTGTSRDMYFQMIGSNQ
jgi:hypothetical protein